MNNAEIENALVLIDDSNIYYGFIKHDWKLDYIKFSGWLFRNFKPVRIYLYGGIISKKTFFDKHPNHTISGFKQQKQNSLDFFKKLRQAGYLVRTKPVTSIFDATSGKFRRKCNFDVEITIEALDLINAYDELVLCSGDGDFLKLVRYVKGKHKKVTLISHKDRLNSEMRTAANRIIFLEDIRSEIEKKRGLP